MFFFIMHQARCTFKRSLHSTNNSSHDNDVLVMTQSRNFICFLPSPQPILCVLAHQAKTHTTCSYASNEPESSLRCSRYYKIKPFTCVSTAITQTHSKQF
jgi:hypothetical protein